MEEAKRKYDVKFIEALNCRIMNQNTLDNVKKRLDKKGKLNVYFLAVSDGKFVYDTIYREMEKLDIFSPKCLLIHKKDMEFGIYQNYISELLHEKELLELSGYDVVVPYDKYWRPLALEDLDIDILFLFASYLDIEPCFFKDKIISPFYLTCFVNYAMRNVNLNDWMYNNEIVNSSWINFVESYDVLREFQKKSYFGTRNIVVSGYPKLDNYVKKVNDSQEIQKQQFDKVVIYAPHWSMHNKGWLNLSTFHYYYDSFEELMEKYSNILFVFKPHPDIALHLRKLANRGVEVEITESQYLEYVERWNNRQNGLVYQGSEYINLFKQADCLITDCGSFTSEWLPSKKPCMYLINPENEKPYDIYNPLGKRILSSYYNCHTWEEIVATFDKVVIQGIDELINKRLSILEESFVKVGESGQYIVEFLKHKLLE